MAGPNHTIEVSWELMSSGKYARTGDDLEITYQDLWGETERVLLESYFSDPKDLVTPNGSILKSHIVNLLAVNSQPLDQTLVAFEDPDAIGEITIAAGTVTVQRAGQTLELQVGDLIYLNDVVESTGGSTGIVFKDDTTLSVDAGARMVIDDFVYDPEQPTTGSMSVNMLSGDFSFISGGVAKTGADAMKVTTPVLTIGVRGTQVAGKASQEGESNEVVLLPNEDGTVGEVALITQAGEVVLTQAFESSTITSAFLPPSIPVIIPKDIVLKKFAKTIATNKTTLKTSKKNKQSKEAEKEKKKLEKEKEELEQEKEQLEEEKEQLEEEAEAIEQEKEQLEEELEEVAEKEKEVELKEEALEEAKIELEEKLEQAPPQEKAKIEEELAKVEEEIVEVEEIREEIVEEKIQFEGKIQEVEEIVQKIEQKFAEVEQKFEAVVVQEQAIEQNFQKIEQEIQKIEQEFEQFFQELEQDFGAEVVNEVAEVFEQANEVHEEKIAQQVEEEIVEEIKMEEQIEDPFEEAPQEEMDQQMEQKVEEEIQQLEEEIQQFEDEPIVEEAIEEDIFKDDNMINEQDKMEEVKIEEEIKEFEIELAKEEPIMDNNFVAFEEGVYDEPVDDYVIEQYEPAPEFDGMEEEFVYEEPVQEEQQDQQVFVNSAPTISTIANVSKSESLTVGSTIATASASDADGDTLTYSLTVDQSGNLAINDNGVITLASAFADVTEDTNYNVTVRATDGTDDAKADFVLTVTADGTLTLSSIHTTGDGTSSDYKQTIGYVNINGPSTVITDLGHTAVNFIPGTTNIDTVDVLWYLNPSNSNWYLDLNFYQTDIFNWVDSGGVFVIHDRYVDGANDFLLGETATITREFNDQANYETIDESSTNLLREGPGGTLTDSSGGDIFGSPDANGEFNLDGGSSTSHGSADYTTFDLTNELALGTKNDTDSVIDFIYKYGAGAVYYSTVPLDYYIGNWASAQAYAKNSLHYATSLIFDGYSQINGTSGAERIYGTAGDDVIFGDYGSDILWGGQGADTFLYTNSNQGSGTIDDIQDFDSSEDSIDISAITSGASVSRTLTNNTQFKLDIDNDGTYDMQFNLVGYTGTADAVTVVT